MIYFLSLMYTYFTVLRCIISVKILINGLFSYWIILTKKKNDHTLLLNKIYYFISHYFYNFSVFQFFFLNQYKFTRFGSIFLLNYLMMQIPHVQSLKKIIPHILVLFL